MNTSQELEIIEIGPLFICPSTREVVLGPDATAAPLNLTRLELDVVTVLARRRGRPMTRDELLDRVWGRGVAVAPHAVEAIISGIRKKLGPHRALLSTQRGVGYRLAPPGDSRDFVVNTECETAGECSKPRNRGER